MGTRFNIPNKIEINFVRKMAESENGWQYESIFNEKFYFVARQRIGKLIQFVSTHEYFGVRDAHNLILERNLGELIHIDSSIPDREFIPGFYLIQGSG